MTRLTALRLQQFTNPTVGFDQIFVDRNGEFSNGKGSGYPPYNVVRVNEDEWTISIAVAGFSMDDLEITLESNTLTIKGTALEVAKDVKYLYKGIAGRNFRKQFVLADHVEVNEATLNLGVLNISLKRHIPEELQPKKIAINTKLTGK